MAPIRVVAWLPVAWRPAAWLAVLLASMGVMAMPHRAYAQNCTYHAEPNRGDWVECGPGGGGGGQRAPNYFGAIALSPSTLQSGGAWSYPSLAAAERQALINCAKGISARDCKIVMWVQNKCMAVATSPDQNAYGSGAGTTLAGARHDAFDHYRNGGGRECVIDIERCM